MKQKNKNKSRWLEGAQHNRYGKGRVERACQRRKSLNRFTPLVLISMSSGGLPPSTVPRFAAMSSGDMSLSGGMSATI
jgi:hypothetical protein